MNSRVDSGLPHGFHLDKNFIAFSNLSSYINNKVWGDPDHLLQEASQHRVIATMMQSAELLAANTAGNILYEEFCQKRSLLFQSEDIRNNLINELYEYG